MKKLLYIFLFLPLGLFGQTQIINVGTTANDGTGDPLRTAMQKINLNTLAVQDSFGNIYREVQTRKLLNDSLTQLRTDAIPLGTLAPSWTDTITHRVVTDTYLQNMLGGSSGTSGKFYVLSGNVDSLGFPDAGDTSLVHTNFIGKHLNVFREGQLQQQHTDNTHQDGYWLNNITGEIRFRPALSGGEQLEIWSTNTIQWESLVAEGGSGEAVSPLLDSILLYFDLDEISGTTVNDAVGSNDGVSTALANQPGQIGRSQYFNASSYITVANNASLLPTDDEFTFSCWFRLDELPSTAARGNQYIARFRDADSFQGYMATIHIEDDDELKFYVTDVGGTVYSAETDVSGISINTWYHLACVLEGTGTTMKIYLNAVDVTTWTGGAFVGNLMQFDSYIIIGNHTTGYSNGIEGYLDEIAVFDEALTITQIAELMTKTHPF